MQFIDCQLCLDEPVDVKCEVAPHLNPHTFSYMEAELEGPRWVSGSSAQACGAAVTTLCPHYTMSLGGPEPQPQALQACLTSLISRPFWRSLFIRKPFLPNCENYYSSNNLIFSNFHRNSFSPQLLFLDLLCLLVVEGSVVLIPFDFLPSWPFHLFDPFPALDFFFNFSMQYPM